MRPRAVALVLFAAVAVACTPDAPTHDAAVGVIEDVCAEQRAALGEIGLPTDVFALAEVADQAFHVATEGISRLAVEGLPAVDDERIQRYVRAATGMNNALAELSRQAELEDVDAM